MALIPPKRLFNVVAMKTVLYDDVADDVKEKGYVAVSHVWGDQKKYTAEQLEIKGGVNWEVPFSDPNKMARVVNAMIYYKKEYCWFDVLCMPQDKQDEINLEIPFMGDYYAGADITFVLATAEYIISEDFVARYDIISEIVESGGNFMEDLTQLGDHVLLDISNERWFKRVWTLQEAVLSKKLVFVGVDGSYVNLSDVISKMEYMAYKRIDLLQNLFGKSVEDLVTLGSNVSEFHLGQHNLVTTTYQNQRRDCFKIHDKFYGILGVLGYKDFVVDYDTSIEDLNKNMAQYAYSKGDISWLSIAGNIGSGFIQPMYQKYPTVGRLFWKEEELNMCDVKFDDKTLCINAMPFATVTRCEKFVASDMDDAEFARWTVCTFKEWGFDHAEIVQVILGFPGLLEPTGVEMAEIILDCIGRGLSNFDAGGEASAQFGDDDWGKYSGDVTTLLVSAYLSSHVATIAIVEDETNTKYPLIIHGDASIGDKIMLVKVHDGLRYLGIVVSCALRKGVCLLPELDISDHLYTPHKFLL